MHLKLVNFMVKKDGFYLVIICAWTLTPLSASSPAPIYQDEQPDAQHYVNRDRLYDFYAKQVKLEGSLLPAFPGLDGGIYGHQGNQNDLETWKDSRWDKSNQGNIFSGVLATSEFNYTKAVWVASGQRRAAFDPLSLSFVAEWEGDLVRLSDMRRGFLLTPQTGGPIKKTAAKAKPNGTYRGFYRYADKVIFSYHFEGSDWLESIEDGAKPHQELRHYTQGGTTRWPGWLRTQATLGGGPNHQVDTVGIPFKNPYGTLFFISGIDFLGDGTAAVATMTGEVWLVKGLIGDLTDIRWKRFATGLHQPLGVKVIENKIYVIGRDQITRLDDLNNDYEADFYACVSQAQASSANGHDYVIGLEADTSGRFMTASANQGVVRITPGNKQVEVLATGMRNPNGIGLSSDGKFLTTSLQEGTWTPSSGIAQVDLTASTPPHFGNHGPLNGRLDQPLLRLPRGEDSSSGGQIFLGPNAWPKLSGNHNLVYLSYGMGSVWMVTRQQVGALWQGAAMRLTGSLRSGLQHGRFNPKDGHLWVTGLNGWQSYTPDDGCLQRLRPSAQVPVLIGHEVRRNGILLRAHRPLSQRVRDAQASFAQCWNYAPPSPQYGSGEFSVRNPMQAGHDRLTIKSVTVLDEGHTVFLEISNLTPAHQVHLRLPWWDQRDADVFLTVHAQAEDFTAIPNYQPHVHEAMPLPQASGDTTLPKSNPVRWEEEFCGLPSREIQIKTASGLQFSPLVITAKTKERLKLVFSNPDNMPHNWVLAAKGEVDKLNQAAGKLAEQPDAFARHYTPDLPSVLAHTRVLLPGESSTIWFQAPDKPGDYTYLCTIPGHGEIMRGTLRVE